MPRHVRFLLLLLVTGASFEASAQDRYVVDEKRYVPVRTGSSLEHRIVFQAPSGTRVSVLESDRASGWSRVRNAEGDDGWLPSRYLKSSPGAAAQLDEALRQLGQEEEGGSGLNAAITKLLEENGALETERDALKGELAELRQLSAKSVQLDQSNRELTEQAQMLKIQIGVLEADNQRLRDDSWQKWFINGVWATGMGGLLTLLLPRIFRRRRRHSEWA